MQLAAAAPPDYAVVDLRLPDGTGVDLARALRRLDGCAEMPIVAMSGLEATLIGIEEVAQLFVGRLLKPVVPAQLLEMLRPPGSVLAEAPAPTGATLLVVDDEPLTRRLLAAYLTREGYAVTTAEDGEAGLRVLREHGADLVVTDVSMPKMDGAALARAIDGDPELRGTPIVFVTAGVGADLPSGIAAMAGGHAIVSKTSDLGGLLRAVERALSDPSRLAMTDPGSATLGRIAEHARVVHALRAQLSTLEGELSVLAGIADAVRRVASVPAVFATTLERLCDLGSVDFAAAWTPDATGELELAGTAGVPPAQGDSFLVLPRQHALFTSALRTGELQFLPSVDEPHSRGRALLARLNLRTATLIPLVTEDRTLGILLLGARRADAGGNGYAVGRTLQSQLVQTLSLLSSLESVQATADAFSAIAENIRDAVITVSQDGSIVYTNRIAKALLGVDASVRGERLTRWLSSDEGEDGPGHDFSGRLRTRGGRTREVAVRASLLPPTSPLGAVAYTVHDLTARRQHEEWLQRLANEDPLTGLPNRRAFERRIEQLTPGPGRRDREGGLGAVFFDLDGFKGLNDRWGHDAGDALLRAVASTLRTRIRHTEFLARVGGDEFVVLLPDAEAREVETLGEVLRALVQTEGRKHRGGVTASVGCAVGAPGEAADAVVEAADRAMYEAKRSGGNQVRTSRSEGLRPAAGATPRAVRRFTSEPATLPSR
jgi:diguanylate cyclase (GGDEF)-like protein/PAS domain S-box-containing protein